MKKTFLSIMLAVVSFVVAFADTDIATYDNVIYAKSVAAEPGETVDVSFCMKNSVNDIASYQFNIYTPKGISVAVDPDDPEFLLAELSTERTTRRKHNTFEAALQQDGSVLVLCASTNNYTFSGNDGEVCVVTFQIAPETLPGDYTVTLNKIVMADTQATSQTYKADGIEFTITVNVSTSIKDITNKTIDGVFYNIAGQRVTNAAKGIIINKGKKVGIR